jgi:HK97 gp10 family phage protein
MPGNVTFKLERAKEFERLLKELGPVPAGRLGQNSLMAGARVIAAEARRNAPVLTGALRKSIGVRSDRGFVRAGSDTRQAFVTARARHAGLVEYGTAKMSPQPYLRPAADEKAAEALDKLGENLGKGLEREALKLATKVGAKK